MRLTSLLLQASNPARFQCVKSQKNPYHRHLERLVCAKKIDLMLGVYTIPFENLFFFTEVSVFFHVYIGDYLVNRLILGGNL